MKTEHTTQQPSPHNPWDLLADVEVPREAQRRIVEGALAKLDASQNNIFAPRRFLIATVFSSIILILSAGYLWGYLRRSNRNPQLPTENQALARKQTRSPTIAANRPLKIEEGPQRLHLGTHAVKLASHTRMRIKNAEAKHVKLLLDSGQAQFDVTPLRGQGSFQVQTPQVQITVIGTSFTVETQDQCSRVQVSKGTVRVESVKEQVFVHAGEYRTICSASALPESLSVEETVFQQALDLLSQPQTMNEAKKQLTRYLQRYPQGFFVEEALQHLILIQKRVGNSQDVRNLEQQLKQTFSH